MADKVEFVTVKSGLGNNRVAFWEQDERHPDGEAYVAGAKSVKVARTAGIEKQLREGVLVEVKSGSKVGS